MKRGKCEKLNFGFECSPHTSRCENCLNEVFMTKAAVLFAINPASYSPPAKVQFIVDNCLEVFISRSFRASSNENLIFRESRSNSPRRGSTKAFRSHQNSTESRQMVSPAANIGAQHCHPKVTEMTNFRSNYSDDVTITCGC